MSFFFYFFPNLNGFDYFTVIYIEKFWWEIALEERTKIIYRKQNNICIGIENKTE